MASDPPSSDEDSPPTDGEGSSAGFAALEQRAAAAADRGAARQRDLESGTTATAAITAATTASPGRWRPRPLALAALVVLVFAAGAVVGWVARGGPTADHAAAPASVTVSLPTTIAPTTPSTSVPPTATTEPPTRPEPAPAPIEVTPPPEGASAPQMHHTVRDGESFWAIAEAEVARVSKQQPDLAQIDAYWRAVVRANADQLVHPGNPDLVYPGQVFVLPAVPSST